jgi:gliding motility-associated-like protein
MNSKRVVWLCLLALGCAAAAHGQIIAFQGGEPGDTWAYTASGASATGLTEAQSSANYAGGSQSIVMGGLSGGGSCLTGGSGNGASVTNVLAFDAVDISTSTDFTRVLTFNYGNRFPECGGTGFDAGENLILTPIFNGIAQAPVVVVTGNNNYTLDIHQTSFTYSVPPCVTSFAFELQINLNRNDEFIFVDDVELSTPGFNAPTVLQCWETLSLNSATGVCEITGTQPQPPVLACWQTTIFNTSTCSWDITGTQPVQPTPVNCWDNYVFDNAQCQWVNNGTQPLQPAPVNCWDNYQFDATLCAWVNLGVQPQQPVAANCWEVFAFNTTTCAWENTSTQPPAPTNVGCGLTAVFNTTLCIWELVPTTPEPTTINCWDEFFYNTTLCAWENIGVQPMQPVVECYETAVFNTTTCAWDVLGTQPAEPATACYETATFNDGGCSWEVTGTQPPQPAVECWQTASFDNTSCAWEFTGVPFSIVIAPLSMSDVAPWSASFSLTTTQALTSTEWLLDGAVVSDAETLDYLFEEAGNYRLVVSAQSSGGCTDTDTLSLSLVPKTSQLIIPDSFTPNFDGINDLFSVVAENLVRFDMRIYNRWGELVFQTNSVLPGWKGFSENGYSYPDGTYVYRIHALGKDGQVYDRTGSVTLLR